MAQALFEAAQQNDVATLTAALDSDPATRDIRDHPHEWTLLHHAARQGHLNVVDLLLDRGFDVNTLETGDHTTALHWAAAAGHVAVVRRLLDAGVDPVGHGDDHELDAIGWATCWDDTDTDRHRQVVALLLERGARHHIFSAIAMNLEDEVRRIIADDPPSLGRIMSRFEDYRMPLHFAVRMNRSEMVALLIKLGANPWGKDGSGFLPGAYAMVNGADRAVNHAYRDRGYLDLFTTVALDDFSVAGTILRNDPSRLQGSCVLPLMAKRGHVAAVRWLLERGADPNALWAHWDARVTPLHMAVFGNHPEAVRALLDAGANPRIADSKHASDAIGWAEFFGRPALARLMEQKDE